MPINKKIKKKKGKLNNSIDLYFPVIKKVFTGLFVLTMLFLYFKVYNPFYHIKLKKINTTYKLLQAETTKIYKEKGYVFDKDTKDDFCLKMANNIKTSDVSCSDFSTFFEKNFKVNKTKVDILGLNRPYFEENGVLVKEFIIDVDGVDKGENATGVDRFPMRVYSTGILGGRIVPANCNIRDKANYDIPYSEACGNGSESTNFLANNKPFGFNVIQIGGDNGKSVEILHDVSFIRADCAAMGGDLVSNDYCDDKQIYWLSACYDEFPCAIEISNDT